MAVAGSPYIDQPWLRRCLSPWYMWAHASCHATHSYSSAAGTRDWQIVTPRFPSTYTRVLISLLRSLPRMLVAYNRWTMQLMPPLIRYRGNRMAGAICIAIRNSNTLIHLFPNAHPQYRLTVRWSLGLRNCTTMLTACIYYTMSLCNTSIKRPCTPVWS